MPFGSMGGYEGPGFRRPRRPPSPPPPPAPTMLDRIRPSLGRTTPYRGVQHPALGQTVTARKAAQAVNRRERKVVRTIARRAGRRYLPGGISPAEQAATLSAFATGRVESQFQNLPYGDADSAGWRQERASIYPNPTNLVASVDRYLSEADQLNRGQGPGELAADVQRPLAMYRGRYAEVLPEARRLARLAGLAAAIRAGT